MKLTELEPALETRGIIERAYSINGLRADEEQYRLEKGGVVWVVYYCERGQELGLRKFLDEEQACDYFLKWLSSDPTTRKK